MMNKLRDNEKMSLILGFALIIACILFFIILSCITPPSSINTMAYEDFQKESINKLKTQQAYVVNYNMFSKNEQTIGNSYASKNYWSIVCTDSSGNTWAMQVAADDVRIQRNTNQNKNYVTFKYLVHDLPWPDNTNWTVQRGYYQVVLYVK